MSSSSAAFDKSGVFVEIVIRPSFVGLTVYFHGHAVRVNVPAIHPEVRAFLGSKLSVVKSLDSSSDDEEPERTIFSVMSCNVAQNLNL